MQSTIADDARNTRAIRYIGSERFVPLLAQLGASLLVSTYHAGRVLMVGTHEGELVLTTHGFELAMGLAVHPRQLAVGTRQEVWFLDAVPDIAATLDPPGRHDACLLARRAHFTGQISGHEMAFGGDELWIVNTLFSCLATLDDRQHFVPRWKPPFISALAGPDDRCHLNGLEVADGSPKYVTALGETDAPQGWRENKATGGVLIDVPSGQVVTRGMAMPHSPRLHEGRLWVLDSGHGALCVVDPATGQRTVVTTFPGYARGLAFLGQFAFVGLSRIRETAVFGGLPIEQQRASLKCGLAVVDLNSGRSIASFEFAEGVEEIFDVKALPGVRCPAIRGPHVSEDGQSPIWVVQPLRWEGGAREPTTAAQWNELGNQRQQQGQVDVAEAAYARAIEVDPALAPAWANRARLLAERGDAVAARENYRRAAELTTSPQIQFAAAAVLPVIYESSEQAEQWRRQLHDDLLQLVQRGVQIDPTEQVLPNLFYLAYQGQNDREIMELVGRLLLPPEQRRLRLAAPSGSRGPRIRLGVLSRYLCDHTIGHLNLRLIERLDREKFECVVLPLPSAQDSIADRYAQAAQRVIPLPEALPAALQAVHAAQLDVLFFPELGMDPLTYTLAASRLAPVQVSTWGHPETSGLTTVDAFLSIVDELEEADQHYTERLVRLERLGVGLERPSLPRPADRAKFGFEREWNLYGCPQSLFKFHPDFDATLAAILLADPQARILLLEGHHRSWTERLEKRLERTLGTVSPRVLWLPRLARDDFRSLVATCDVLLDPLHFGGGHTSYEAFALGAPVVTLPSRLLRGRLTLAQLRQMGMTDAMVASDADDYVARAVGLATNREHRRRTSERILESAAALFDDIGAQAAFENALESLAASKR
jgi:protein O-GlcNAc transferase